MGLGISFGKKKQSSSTSGTLTKDETTNQNTTATKAGTQSSTNSTNATSASQGASSTNQTGVVANEQVSGSAVESISKSFSDKTQTGLESLVENLLGGAGRSGLAADSAIRDLSGFDTNSFVNDTVEGARGRIQSDEDRALNGLADRIGSAEGNNSMAMLLSNRVRGDSASTLAGVRSNAVAQGQTIARENAMARVSAAGSESGFLGSLLAALKGGQQSQSQVGAESQSGTQTSNTAGTTATTESNQQSSIGTEDSVLTEVLNQLLTGRTQSIGTEDSKTKGKSGGFGLSLGL